MSLSPRMIFTPSGGCNAALMTKTSIFVSRTHQSWLLNVADLEVLAHSILHQPHHRSLEDHRLHDVVVV